MICTLASFQIEILVKASATTVINTIVKLEAALSRVGIDRGSHVRLIELDLLTSNPNHRIEIFLRLALTGPIR